MVSKCVLLHCSTSEQHLHELSGVKYLITVADPKIQTAVRTIKSIHNISLTLYPKKLEMTAKNGTKKKDGGRVSLFAWYQQIWKFRPPFASLGREPLFSSETFRSLVWDCVIYYCTTLRPNLQSRIESHHRQRSFTVEVTIPQRAHDWRVFWRVNKDGSIPRIFYC